jgi:hypothetical protein
VPSLEARIGPRAFLRALRLNTGLFQESNIEQEEPEGVEPVEASELMVPAKIEMPVGMPAQAGHRQWRRRINASRPRSNRFADRLACYLMPSFSNFSRRAN